MGEASEPLFTLFGILDVTPEVTTMWGIILVLTVVSIFVSHRLKERPGKLQNAVETGLEKLESYYTEILGARKTQKYFVFFGTLFIFIITANFSGLLPGSGNITGLKAPTSSLSVTAGLGVVVFMATHVFGIKECGLKKYLKKFIMPVFFILPFLLIDELVRPVSLALRLFGNIFGEETVTGQLYNLLPIGAPLLMMVLSLLFCTIQAVVFTMLTAIYIDDATSLEE